jgi:hypothetical protein
MDMNQQLFWQMLFEASHELAERNGRDVIFAAPLANLIQQKLRRKLADENLELAGPLYGPALFPDIPATAYGGLKFRTFLEAFPDLVEVFRGPSGDMVRVLKAAQEGKVEELAVKYRDLLRRAMQEISLERGEETIPAVQLAKRLKKFDPAFDPKRAGYTSLVDWLESQKDIVEVTHREFGGRIRLLSPASESEAALLGGVGAQTVPAGYLIVDSADIIATLHTVLGGRPTGPQLPEWSLLLRFFKERFPGVEWKGRYFMTLGKSPADTTEGFKGYLEAVGFKVIQLALGSEILSREELLEERVNANRIAVAKMLSVVDSRTSHVFVVSHSESVAAPLSRLLELKGPGVSVGVVGFPEKCTESVLRLRQSGLTIFDIERDAKLFKQPVPRRQLISPESFDPAHYL